MTEQEKAKILSINEEDKFVFRVMDNIVKGLQNSFPQYTKNYIIEVLRGNSMNIENAYIYLSDPIRNSSIIFTEAEDKLILEMKGSGEYNLLVAEKGQDRVQEREDYLLA